MEKLLICTCFLFIFDLCVLCTPTHTFSFYYFTLIGLESFKFGTHALKFDKTKVSRLWRKKTSSYKRRACVCVGYPHSVANPDAANPDDLVNP